jgi:hypothetical protein
MQPRTWSWWDVASTAVSRKRRDFGWSRSPVFPRDPMDRLAAWRERARIERARSVAGIVGESPLLRTIVVLSMLVAVALWAGMVYVQWAIVAAGLAYFVYLVLWRIRGRRAFGSADNTIVRRMKRRRIAEYARAARSLGPAQIGALSKDLPRRVELWRSALSTNKGLTARGPFVFADPWMGLTILAVVVALFAAPIASAGHSPGRGEPWMWIFWTLMILAALLGPFRLRRLRRRLLRALNERVCPNCWYDLVSLPPALEPKLTGGYSTGPSRCPECGSPWPLLPPPVAEGPGAPAEPSPTAPASTAA